MNIFLDANILVSVLNKEYPLYPHAARILSLSQSRKYTVFTSPLCLGIAFYFAEKKHKRSLAKSKIALLAENISLTTIDEAIVRKALKHKAIEDFEDGMEYYSAIDSGCKCIITEDADDFYFSNIEIISAEKFELKYMK